MKDRTSHGDQALLLASSSAAIAGASSLIAKEAVRRKIVLEVSDSTIGRLLKRHELKPWREKMGCVAEIDDEYIERMEDVLKTYELPLSYRSLSSASMKSRSSC